MSLSHWISIFFTTITSLLLRCSCIDWSAIFHDADLTFAFSWDGDTSMDVDKDFPYFQVVRIANPYTLLRHFVVSQSNFTDLRTTLIRLKKHGYRETEKSARAKVIFVNLVASIAWKYKLVDLITPIDRSFQQEFVFGYFHGKNDLLCFRYHVLFLNTVKLVLFTVSTISPLYVPCLTCGLERLSEVKTLSLPDIKQAWDNQNSNLHNYIIFVPSLVQGKCALLQDGLVNLSDSHNCPMLTIAGRYNLTVLDNKSRHMLYNQNSFAYALMDKDHHATTFLHEIEILGIDFLTITNPPSPASGVPTFVSPFDKEIWHFLLVYVICVAGFLAFVECKAASGSVIGDGEVHKTLISYAILMAEKVITVTSVFLGQVGDSSGKLYRKGKVALIILILFLFGNLFLVVNYYQGSIYSCLAVLLPPQTPRGVEELVDYDIQTIYMDEVDSMHNYLQEILIPQLLKNFDQKPKFCKFLTKLSPKLLSYGDESVAKLFLKIINEKSTRTHDMIAIFTRRDKFESYMNLVKYSGNRHIVRNTGDSPFRVVLHHFGFRNLFTTYLAKGLKRVQESGLTDMWKKLDHFGDILANKNYFLTRGKYFQAAL